MVQQKLQSGRYQNLDDLLLQAFQLLDDWEKHSLTESPDWIASTRIKVDASRGDPSQLMAVMMEKQRSRNYSINFAKRVKHRNESIHHCR
jgi:hypothetical protein